MARINRSEGSSLQYRRELNLNTPGSSAIQLFSGQNVSDFFQIDYAEVIDIIYDKNHPDYEVDSDIGKIKIRFVDNRAVDTDVELSWAYPINLNSVVYPIKGEIVYILTILGKQFYLGNINYHGNLNNNLLKDISKPATSTNEDNVNSYQQVSNTTPNQTINDSRLGDTFVDNNKKIKRIKPHEGDYILSGRFGNNIRLGNNPKTNSPNIKISVGQPLDIEKSSSDNIYEEDINNTPNSIWITIDEAVNLNPITKGNSYYLKSAKSVPNAFDGNQIIINSDRIIWNSKKNETFIFSNKGISLNSNGYIAIDSYDTIGITTAKEINIQSANSVNVDSPKINLGKNADEPLVLGNKLVNILSELIDAILQQTHPTGAGPSGTPINAAQFRLIKNKLSRTILSKQNKTV